MRDDRPVQHPCYRPIMAFFIFFFLLSMDISAATPVNTGGQKPWVNVKDFGAIGNGLADDTKAIQDAVSSIGKEGGFLFFPPGHKFRHSAGISLKSNMIVIGHGSTLKATDTAKAGPNGVYGFKIDGQSDISVIGIIYDGNRSARGPRGAVGGDTGPHSVFIRNSRNILLKDLTIKDSPADGILMMYSDVKDPSTRCFNVTGINVTVENAYRNGLSVVGAKGVSFYGSRFNSTNGTAPQTGIDVEADRTAGPSGVIPEDIRFYDSITDNNRGYGLVFSSYTARSGAYNHRAMNNGGWGMGMVEKHTNGCEIIGGTVGNNEAGLYVIGTGHRLADITLSSNKGKALETNGNTAMCDFSNLMSIENADGFHLRGRNNRLSDSISRKCLVKTGVHLDLAGTDNKAANIKAFGILNGAKKDRSPGVFLWGDTAGLQRLGCE